MSIKEKRKIDDIRILSSEHLIKMKTTQHALKEFCVFVSQANIKSKVVTEEGEEVFFTSSFVSKNPLNIQHYTEINKNDS